MQRQKRSLRTSCLQAVDGPLSLVLLWPGRLLAGAVYATQPCLLHIPPSQCTGVEYMHLHLPRGHVCKQVSALSAGNGRLLGQARIHNFQMVNTVPHASVETVANVADCRCNSLLQTTDSLCCGSMTCYGPSRWQEGSAPSDEILVDCPVTLCLGSQGARVLGRIRGLLSLRIHCWTGCETTTGAGWHKPLWNEFWAPSSEACAASQSAG